MTRTAVLLQNLGGPASQADMYPFLLRLFSDPEIINLPGLFRKPLAKWIARRRAPESWKNYERIGGSSPVLAWTERQGQGLAARIATAMPNEEFLVLPAMRYTKPLIADSIDTARAWQATRLLSFSLYPQYSTTSVGSSERELERRLSERNWQPELLRLSRWSDDAGYLDCMATRVRAAIEALPKEHRKSTHLVFSAHGTPMKFVKSGDPYVDEIAATVAGIRQRLDTDLPWSLAYQSRVGPMKWTQPHLIPHLQQLASSGCRSVLVVAVSFVSDHVETLFELDIEVRDEAIAAGIEHYARAESLNAGDDFLDVLAHLAVAKLRPV